MQTHHHRPEIHQLGAHHPEAHHQLHSSFVEANKNYFDTHTDQAEARSRSPMYEKMAQEITKAMMEMYKFDEATTSVMDYACGPGMFFLRIN
jgi:hypothetical protein